MIGILDQIREATSKKLLRRFESNFKKLSGQQIIDIIKLASKETAVSILHDWKKGADIEDVAKKWIIEEAKT